jgi:hypothetical protein
MKRAVRWVVCVVTLMYVPAPDAGAQEMTTGRTLADTMYLAAGGSPAADYAWPGDAIGR